MDLIGKLFEIAGKYHAAMPELVLGWVLAREGVTSVLVGARSVAQVTENLAMDPGRFPAEAWEECTSASESLKAEIGDHADMFQDPSRTR
jgi:aryl-alcohol dehydrogenase-like predicted oxidoreductase